MSGSNVVHNEAARRYELEVDGESVGFVEYSRVGEAALVFSRTDMDPAYAARGLGDALARGALDDARRRGMQIVPACPIVAAFIRRNPQYVGLVRPDSRAGFEMAAMKKNLRWLVPFVLLIAIALAIAWWFGREKPEPKPAPPPAPVATPAPPPAVEPAVRHPIDQAKPEPAEALPPAPALPPLAESDAFVQSEIVGLVGRDAVVKFLNLNGFVRRAVATVDNLPREKAAVRLWPVQPTDGRFTTRAGGSGEVIDAANFARYEPFVAFVESVSAGKAVAIYVRLYPLFQQAYEDLGYPGKYFNDRLVEVIDHLLAAPEIAPPIAVVPPEVKGPVKLEQPWVMYRYADPLLESRSAGQKILIRVGPENAARLKTKLREIRRQVAGGVPRQ